MVTDLFFQIHYCKGQKLKNSGKVTHRVTRTLQHHEFIFVSEADGSIAIGERRFQMKRGMLFYIKS